MQRKKIMVIGAGTGQIPIIKHAIENNLYVIAVSLKGRKEVIELVDEYLSLDIYHKDAIVKYGKDVRIDAVVSDQNDMTMPTVAYVSEKLNLPGNKYEQAIAYSNKNTFRSNCEKIGIPIPKHIAIKDTHIPESFIDTPLPWIVKPEDSQSSIGVRKINTLEEYEEAALFAINSSRNRKAILEEFFEGQEVVCEGFIYMGEFHLLNFADRRYFNLNNMMIPSQTIFPSLLPQDILDKIIDYETMMANYIAPNFGIVHAEYLVNLQTNEIRVVESALRGGGVFISSHLIPMSTGVNINKLLLDCALGVEENMNSKLIANKNKSAAYICFHLPEGDVFSITGLDELKKLHFVKHCVLDDIKIGSYVNKMENKGMRKGPILIEADNRKELEEYIKVVQNTFIVKVKTRSGNILKMFWE